MTAITSGQPQTRGWPTQRTAEKDFGIPKDVYGIATHLAGGDGDLDVDDAQLLYRRRSPGVQKITDQLGRQLARIVRGLERIILRVERDAAVLASWDTTQQVRHGADTIPVGQGRDRRDAHTTQIDGDSVTAEGRRVHSRAPAGLVLLVYAAGFIETLVTALLLAALIGEGPIGRLMSWIIALLVVTGQLFAAHQWGQALNRKREADFRGDIDTSEDATTKAPRLAAVTIAATAVLTGLYLTRLVDFIHPVSAQDWAMVFLAALAPIAAAALKFATAALDGTTTSRDRDDLSTQIAGLDRRRARLATRTQQRRTKGLDRIQSCSTGPIRSAAARATKQWQPTDRAWALIARTRHQPVPQVADTTAPVPNRVGLLEYATVNPALTRLADFDDRLRATHPTP